MDVITKFYTWAKNEPFTLQCGEALSPVTMAYETYGELNAGRDNAILVFHALSGSQHAAGFNPAVEGLAVNWNDECRTGWWDSFIGPGLMLDTNRYFIICVNYLGGCYGSTGPSSIDPATSRPYGSGFPRLGINDIVDSQVILLKHLGIEQLHAVTGASLGGIMAINLAVRYPQSARRVIVTGCGLRLTVLQKMHNFEQIFAIEEDLNFRGGDYYDGSPPARGLALARMIQHKTFISLDAIGRRSRDEIIQHEEYLSHYELSHTVESYLLHQGKKYVQRFDANTHLRIIEAWQRMDLCRDAGCESFQELFSRCRHQHYLVFSIASDVCFYPDEQHEMAETLRSAGVPCILESVYSDKGHDSFLIEPELYAKPFKSFIE